MSYNVNFTDTTLNPEPLVVEDNTPNSATSLVFPGRNVTGYGKIIAENFLHLLENFSSPTAPNSANAVVGQLWYNSEENKLFVYDGIDWKTTSNIRTAVTEPTGASPGDLWVNSSTQQLYLWSGTSWVLVGPQFSEGTKSGPLVETILDIDNRNRTVIIFYTNDIPVAIISKDTFIPKVVIQGFTSIGTGINLTTRTDITDESVRPRLIGVAAAADALVIGTTTIPSTSFLRTDIGGTVQAQINVKTDSGVFLGTNSNFNISVRSAGGIIYNSTPGAAIDIETSKTGSFGVPTKVVRVIEDKVGINNATPAEALDIIGNLRTSGEIATVSESNSTNLGNGALRSAGGLAVTKNAVFGGDLTMLNGTLLTRSLRPTTISETIGTATEKYSTIYADNIVASEIRGTLVGSISGNAGSATSLVSATNFKLEGDISSNVVSFNGTGNLNKTFTTTLTSDIISNKPSLGNSQANDELLVFRANSGLRKITRAAFIDDAAVPVGSIFPYAGIVAPTGYLLCDGTEYEEYRFRELSSVLGTRYNGATALLGSPKGITFRVPDLRGRLPLGRQNMEFENDISMPFPGGSASPRANSPLITPRVDESNASILGASGGSYQYVIEQYNLPDHDHDLKGRRSDNNPSGSQFYVINETATEPTDFAPQTLIGGSGTRNTRTKIGTVLNGGQRMESSGLVRILVESKRTPGLPDSLVGRPFGVMNPYITLNYIIRSGKPTND
jgi:microcystin-dependent protein